MESIANLIDETRNQIDEFEKFMFTSHLGKYITSKECLEYMKAKIGNIESRSKINALDEGSTNEATDSLNSIINKIKKFTEAFKSGKNVTIVVDEDGEYVTEEITPEESLTKFDEFQPIESSAVKIVDYDPTKEDLDKTSPTIEIPEDIKQDAVTAIEEIPEIKEETVGDEENFTNALDVQAIDNFLNEMNSQDNSATDGLRL